MAFLLAAANLIDEFVLRRRQLEGTIPAFALDVGIESRRDRPLHRASRPVPSPTR